MTLDPDQSDLVAMTRWWNGEHDIKCQRKATQCGKRSFPGGAIIFYDESLDEPAKLLADEPVDLERETPTEENEPIESTEATEPAQAPVFER